LGPKSKCSRPRPCGTPYCAKRAQRSGGIERKAPVDEARPAVAIGNPGSCCLEELSQAG
jgi:hypothetical protein